MKFVQAQQKHDNNKFDGISNDLYTESIKLEENIQIETEKDNTFIFLADIADVIEEYGLTEPVNTLINEDSYLTDFLNIDLEQYETSQEKGEAVSEVIWNYIEDYDEDWKKLKVNEEILTILVGSFLVGYGIGTFLNKWLRDAEKVHEKMADIWNNKLDKKEDDLNLKKFYSTKLTIIPSKHLTSFVKGLNELGEFLEDFMDKADNLDRKKLADIFNGMGLEIKTESSGSIKFNKKWEMTRGTPEELGLDFEEFKKIYKGFMDALEMAINVGDAQKKFIENFKEKSKEKKKEAKSKKEYKEAKKELAQNKKVYIKALKWFYDDVRAEAESFMEMTNPIKPKQ